MKVIDYVPSWYEIEQNLEQRFSHLNQGVYNSIQSAHDSWNGFTRRVNQGAIEAYGQMGGNQIDHVRHALDLSYPIMQMDLTRKWASINIAEILPVLLKLVQEVVMIIGGSVMVGAFMGGAAGSIAGGVGALPGAAIGGGIGLEVGNLILVALGLYSIAGYFSEHIGPCLETISNGLATAWHAEDGLKPPGLDPSGGSAAEIEQRIGRAARQLANGQEQLVVLLLMAIVVYLTRGQIRSGVSGSLDSIAARSAKLQSEISNKELANWLAKNEQRILAQPELQPREAAPLARVEPEPQPLREKLGAKGSGGSIDAGFDTANLQSKLQGYLLDAKHPQNQTKATWFQQALGFDKSNWEGLASQIQFNEAKAVITKTTQYGQTYEQQIPIIGTNGRIIDVPFIFLKDTKGVVKLVTGIPAKI